MNPKPIIPLFIICLLCCSQIFSQKVFKEALPPDFNCAGCILVVIKKDPSNIDPDRKFNPTVNKLIEKKLIKEYDGKSVFISAADLDSNKLYADTSIYRFTLTTDIYTFRNSMPTTSGNGRTGTMNYTQPALNCHLYDRMKKIEYQQMSNYPTWPKTMEKVTEALNKLLKN